jgi:hypothetical protein
MDLGRKNLKGVPFALELLNLFGMIIFLLIINLRLMTEATYISIFSTGLNHKGFVKCCDLNTLSHNSERIYYNPDYSIFIIRTKSISFHFSD